MTPRKSNQLYWSNGTIPWLASMDISDPNRAEIRGRITETALTESPLTLVEPPAVAVIMRSNILRRAFPVRLLTSATTLNQDVRALVPSTDVEATYVYQCLKAASESIRQSCVRTDGSMAGVISRRFFNWEIPVPPLATQRKIAAQLQHFEELEISLSNGLPAELAARRKQYEYYRDKLLTFEEAR